jgi:hypothetical protein
MRIKWILMAVFLTVILLNFPACNKLENLNESASTLIVIGITGADQEGNLGATTIFSDVLTSSGSIFNDTATATLTAELLDPLIIDSTFYQDIIVDQVDVEYSRSDIPDAQQGVDVPFGFSQKVYTRVGIGDEVELAFVLVQHVAKLDSPLVELTDNLQEKILKMEAKCTFYGKDVAGNRITPVTATISVWFSNFADDN